MFGDTMTFTQRKRTARINKLYDIVGDGVARLKMHQAVKDWRFRRTVLALRDMKIQGE